MFNLFAFIEKKPPDFRYFITSRYQEIWFSSEPPFHPFTVTLPKEVISREKQNSNANKSDTRPARLTVQRPQGKISAKESTMFNWQQMSATGRMIRAGISSDANKDKGKLLPTPARQHAKYWQQTCLSLRCLSNQYLMWKFCISTNPRYRLLRFFNCFYCNMTERILRKPFPASKTVQKQTKIVLKY